MEEKNKSTDLRDPESRVIDGWPTWLEIPLEEDEESFSDSELEPASGLIGADEPPDDSIKDDQDGEEEIT